MATRSLNLKNIKDWNGWDFESTEQKIAGGVLSSQTSRDSALYSQLQILPYGARILNRVGLNGQTEFLVVDGVNFHNASKIYPDKDKWRTLSITKSRLTPGYNLRASALFVPNGPTQTAASMGGFYEHDTDTGGIRITAYIDNGISNTSEVVTMNPLNSLELYKGLRSTAAGNYKSIHYRQAAFKLDDLKTISWVENVHVEITIEVNSTTRPLDIIVFEVPNIATHDDTNRECTIPMSTGIKSPYALTGKSYTGEAIWGSHQASKSMRDYKNVVGPMLMSWTPWNEAVNTIANVEPTPFTTTSTTYQSILDSTITTYNSAGPGWSLSSAGTARNLEQAGSIELRNVNGCIPVLCRAYLKGGGAGITATVKFQSEVYSQVEMSTTSATYVWVEKLAWLRCGTHQSDPSVLQIFLKSSSIVVSAGLKYATVEYYGNYTVAQ